jgi:ribosomal protein S18 acetylase RimI-like enzyme
MSSSSTVRNLQERAARALPAGHVEHLQQWWLRYAPNCAWWVGTVLPHGDAGPEELVNRVAMAEKFYGDRGVATCFQISPSACPEGLDGFLAARGYRLQSSVSLQVASTARVLEQVPTASYRVRVDYRRTRAWFEAWQAVNGNDGDPRAGWDMLGRVEQPSAYARAMVGGDIVAVGRVVADTGWAGVFDLAVLPRARGKGAGRDVVVALADWAGGSESEHMYLQVERNNFPALRLYERMGFNEICDYHYRTTA